jgi:hypothetical protein
MGKRSGVAARLQRAGDKAEEAASPTRQLHVLRARQEGVALGQQRAGHHVVLYEPADRLAVRRYNVLMVGVHDVVPLRPAVVVLHVRAYG